MTTDDGFAMVLEEPVCATSSELFQPSKTFTGGKPGFCFKLGNHGQGYYLDLSDAELDNELSRCLKLDDKAAESPAKLPIIRLAFRGRFDLVSRALATRPELWHVTVENGATLLHVAAQKGDADFLRSALRDGPHDVDATGKYQKTPLMCAVALGQLGAIRVLLSARANPRFRCSSGCTPMMLALQHNQRTSVLLLLASCTEDRVALLHDLDNIGCTAVHWAAYMGDLDSLKLLGRLRANLTDVDKSRNTALHRALQAEQNDHGKQTLEFLIEQGVDPSAENAYGRTCMDIAKDASNPAVLDALDKVLGTTRSAELKKIDPVDLEVGAGKRDRNGKRVESLREWLGVYLPMFMFIGCLNFAVFEYVLDIRQLAWERVWPAALAFETGVCMSVCLFVYVATSDPGRVAPDQYHDGMEAIMRALRDGRDLPAQRLCTSTWVLKGLRTKYCKVSGACIREFDHFCDFTACPIGERNHRPFIVLACVELATQAWHVLLCAIVVFLTSGVPPSFREAHIWAFKVAWRYPLMVLAVDMHIATGTFVVYTLVYQAITITLNLTQNEMLNWTRYEHFWRDPSQPPTKLAVSVSDGFTNPFYKGTFVHNWVDFWWWRSRDEVGPMCSQRVAELHAALKDAGAH